ncbi:type I restriction-modification system subunit M N-terminal domain-containing protein [Streptomyces lydicus]|uniref:type I restriction-modification system subunit M N-terminal domain-containing protein n=1 Tax=Streptomyces lydicus TaxID=47763 RepID=UPI0037B7E511
MRLRGNVQATPARAGSLDRPAERSTTAWLSGGPNRMPRGDSTASRPPPGHEQGHPRLMAVTQQEIENRLWDAADELRVAMPEAQYSSVVFPLMFWKYLSDTWEHTHQTFLKENEDLGLTAEEADEVEYSNYQTFKIPFIYPGTVAERRASWSSILATVAQHGLGQRVRALSATAS